MQQDGVEVFPESPPRGPLACFRDAIQHGTDWAVIEAVRRGRPDIAYMRYLGDVRVVLLGLIEEMEKESRI